MLIGTKALRISFAAFTLLLALGAPLPLRRNSHN